MNIQLKKRINFTALTTFVVAVTLFSFIIFKLKKEDPITAEAKLFIGREIPAVEVLNADTGENYLEKIKSGEVLLVYLISGCDACKKEVQIINEINKQPDSALKFFGVMSEKSETVKEYVAAQAINFPVLVDKEGKLFNEFNLKYFPANFNLVNGIIKKASFGSPKNQEDVLNLFSSNR